MGKKLVLFTILFALIFSSVSFASEKEEAMDTGSWGIAASVQSTPKGLLISWESEEEFEAFRIYRKEKNEKTWAKEGKLNGSMREYLDTTVLPWKEYEYSIKGFHDLRNEDEYVRFQAKGTWEASPRDIPAGTILSLETVEAMGLENFFYVEEIDDATFARMWGKSYKEYCTVPRSELRYIRCLHKDIDKNIKVGELVMNVKVADAVCDIFRQLYFFSYPIESMLLVDEYDADDGTSIMHNNTSAFNFRNVDGTDQISNHAYGLAIDINPYYNVYYVPATNYIFPVGEYQYLDREADFPYKLVVEDVCYMLFTQAGFNWGGWWKNTIDYQHFEYTK